MPTADLRRSDTGAARDPHPRCRSPWKGGQSAFGWRLTVQIPGRREHTRRCVQWSSSLPWPDGLAGGRGGCGGMAVRVRPPRHRRVSSRRSARDGVSNPRSPSLISRSAPSRSKCSMLTSTTLPSARRPGMSPEVDTSEHVSSRARQLAGGLGMPWNFAMAATSPQGASLPAL